MAFQNSGYGVYGGVYIVRCYVEHWRSDGWALFSTSLLLQTAESGVYSEQCT